MGKDLYDAFPTARGLFGRAEIATGLPLKDLCFEGPEDELARTDISQPAIFTVSAAALACMRDFLGPEAQPKPSAVAGLSLGEYVAFYAAGAMDFDTGVRLVARRGQVMQEAATAVPSGMVSVLGLDEQKALDLCRAAAQGQVLSCANFNCPGQIVLSGETDACRRAAEMAEDFGAAAAIPLKVAGAFHCEIMRPAAEKLASALDEVAFTRPSVSVICNTDAAPCADGDEIRPKLLAQLVSPIRWQQSMEHLLAEGFERFYEIGPGRVLAGLMKRIRRRVAITSVNCRAAVEKLALP